MGLKNTKKVNKQKCNLKSLLILYSFLLWIPQKIYFITVNRTYFSCWCFTASGTCSLYIWKLWSHTDSPNGLDTANRTEKSCRDCFSLTFPEAVICNFCLQTPRFFPAVVQTLVLLVTGSWQLVFLVTCHRPLGISQTPRIHKPQDKNCRCR